MNLFKRPVRPAYLLLAACLLLFLWKTSQIAAVEREVASALAELEPGRPGVAMNAFIRDYLSDPFGKAMGLSQHQLQLCQQISARVPQYESAVAWRNDALGIGFATLLYLAFLRYRSRLRLDELRARGRAWLQRQAIRMAPLVEEARRRAEEKRAGGSGFGRRSPGRAESVAVHDIVACPKCGQKLRVPSGKGTLRVRCSGCSTQFECRT